MFQIFAGCRQLSHGLVELRARSGERRARPIAEPRARRARSQGGSPAQFSRLKSVTAVQGAQMPEPRAVHSCKQSPALGFPRCWHQFFPLEWSDFTEAVSERSRGSTSLKGRGLWKRGAQNLCNEKGERSFVMQLCCYNIQYRIWRVLGGKVSSHVVIMQPSAVLGRFKNTLCIS